MKSLAISVAMLLGICLSSEARADDPLEMVPSGMTRCLEDIPCIRLSIKNNGALPISFGTDGFLRPEVSRPGIQYFSSDGVTWREFGQMIGTFMAPRRLTTIEPGETTRLYVPVTDIPSDAIAVRVSVQDKSRVFHDSLPFDLTGKVIPAKR